MIECTQLMREARRVEAVIRNDAMRFVLGHVFDRKVRRTGHYREWYRIPMNYARQMELPLTWIYLNASPHETILDVSSPKLLALHYALGGYTKLVAADLEDYFVNDFKTYADRCALRIQTAVFDAAARIPFPDNHFDKAFSVSVLEHIPHDGDGKAAAEMLRVLKPGGTMVITLPAFGEYVEEWTSSKHYWESVRNEKGEMFFQRRYDPKALAERFPLPGAVVEDTVWIAEHPVEAPRIGSNGTMLHNSYYIDKVPSAQRWLRAGRKFRRIPFLPYLAERRVSRQCHYLTRDPADPNVRQVALKIVKDR